MSERNYKRVQSHINFLAVVVALNYSGKRCGKVELAQMLGWSKRTVERVAAELVEQSVLVRTGGKGRQPYQYEFTGVYHGRFGVMVYIHPDRPNIVVIQTDEGMKEIEIYK
jgi:hypothetical protein